MPQANFRFDLRSHSFSYLGNISFSIWGNALGNRARKRLALLSALVGLIMLAGVGFTAGTASSASELRPRQCFTALPGAKGRTFFVDPVAGRDDGDGSFQRPWRSLSKVLGDGLVGDHIRDATLAQKLVAKAKGSWRDIPLRLNGRAVVHGGDTIMLRTGNHGRIAIASLANDQPITITAAPGAKAQVDGISVADARNFTFRNLVVAPARSEAQGFLVTTRPRPDVKISRDIRFAGMTLDGPGSIASSSPADWARQGDSGALLAGDCISFEDSKIRDVRFGFVIYQSDRVTVARNDVRGFSVDGVDFSGNDILIADNVIADHWPTGDSLHPDCMQGQTSAANPSYSRVTITGNICLSDTVSRHSKNLQGINIFIGRWRDVTVSCNFVRPSIYHGIAMYGLDNAKIDRNVVLGWRNEYPAWIGAFRSLEGRQPTGNVISNNEAFAYINAIHGSDVPPDRVIDSFRMGANAREFRSIVGEPITGVTLTGNAWIRPGPDLSHDPRFTTADEAAPPGFLSVEQARARLHALCPRT